MTRDPPSTTPSCTSRPPQVRTPRPPPSLGTWAKDVVVDASSLYKVPASFDVEVAAGMVSAPAVAYRLLNDFAKLEAGTPSRIAPSPR